MPGPFRHRVLNPPTTYVAAGKEEPLQIGRYIVRDRDPKFIKLFPIFTAAILTAMRDKKLKGAADTLFFFLNKLMDVCVNGTEDQITIRAPADLIAQETGKSVRAVREHLAILLELGLIRQPHRGEPRYVIPPHYAYRGIVEKLLKARFKKGAPPLSPAMKEVWAPRPKKNAPPDQKST